MRVFDHLLSYKSYGSYGTPVHAEESRNSLSAFCVGLSLWFQCSISIKDLSLLSNCYRQRSYIHLVDGEQAIKPKAGIIKHAMISDVQSENPKIGIFQSTVILGMLHVQSSDPMTSLAIEAVVQFRPVSLPTYSENTGCN